MIHAEVLSIGSELTSGQSLDTNSQWLSRRLAEVGVEVRFHTTVADNLEANLAVIECAAKRAPLVLVTGGLGPTADDLTRDVLAQWAGVKLVLDAESLARIEAMFQRRSRPMPERNRIQAYFPDGAVPIPNARGTAPGIWLEHQGCVVICMPGVPDEMHGMFEDWVVPRLRDRFPLGQVTIHRALHCFGSGESHIEELLGDVTRRGRVPEVGITASEATISLRITASAATVEDAELVIQPTVDEIRQKLGSLIYGEGEETLPAVVARLLQQTDMTISTAESCTGGLVGHLLTEVPGISRHYVGGVVAYSNDAKQDLVAVPAQLIEEFGAVSPEVATAMARGCRSRFQSDLAIGVTGIAGPDGGSTEKPVGLVYIALAHGDNTEIGKYNWPAGRSSVKIRSAKTALNLVRLHLQRQSSKLDNL